MQLINWHFNSIEIFLSLKGDLQVLFFSYQNVKNLLLLSLIAGACLSVLSPPSNGDISCTSSKNTGSRCTYSCSSGYRLTGGSTTRTCTWSGSTASWDGSAPTCTRKRWNMLSELFRWLLYLYIQGGPKRTERHTSGNKDIKWLVSVDGLSSPEKNDTNLSHFG